LSVRVGTILLRLTNAASLKIRYFKEMLQAK